MSKSVDWGHLCLWAFAGSMAVLTSPAFGQVREQSIETPSSQSADAQAAPQGGSSTAGVFAPVLDSEHRPITAGGFVKTGPIVFEDISAEAGLSTGMAWDVARL